MGTRFFTHDSLEIDFMWPARCKKLNYLSALFSVSIYDAIFVLILGQCFSSTDCRLPDQRCTQSCAGKFSSIFLDIRADRFFCVMKHSPTRIQRVRCVWKSSADLGCIVCSHSGEGPWHGCMRERFESLFSCPLLITVPFQYVIVLPSPWGLYRRSY